VIAIAQEKKIVHGRRMRVVVGDNCFGRSTTTILAG